MSLYSSSGTDSINCNDDVLTEILLRLPVKSLTRFKLLEVYDSLSRTWKVCLEPFTAPVHVKFSCGVHWNNVIHWEYKMYYDIEKNVIEYLPRPIIPWPEGWGSTASCCQLQESKGHLYFFIIISNSGEKSIAVFEMKGDYSGWVLKYNDRIGRAAGRPRILSFIMGDGEEETSTLVFHVPGKITAYRFREKSFTELVDLTNEPFYREDSVQFEPRDTYQFGESLAPV
ncbi:hypothetical protein BUALT_Bualt06G0141700 [Buddleja alternifolia]|uniref:F-box protein n=1 Tax=Buddleja alternifolia TaxID=168488 RepID=A0AAV6XM46_9LAMI|nr:hypothetical protein BUALT_Bualt06G0141700 [Buddleja alternifolia]